MRVYEIAKEVGIPNKDLIAKIRALGLEVNNHMSSLDPDAVARIRRSLEKEKQSVAQPQQTQRLSTGGAVLRRRSSGEKPTETSSEEREPVRARGPQPELDRGAPSAGHPHAAAPVIRRRVVEDAPAVAPTPPVSRPAAVRSAEPAVPPPVAERAEPSPAQEARPSERSPVQPADIEPQVEHRGEPRIEHRAEHRVEPQIEPRVEHRAEHRVEPQIEPRVEHRAEHRAEAQIEPRVEPRVEQHTAAQTTPPIKQEAERAEHPAEPTESGERPSEREERADRMEGVEREPRPDHVDKAARAEQVEPASDRVPASTAARPADRIPERSVAERVPERPAYRPAEPAGAGDRPRVSAGRPSDRAAHVDRQVPPVAARGVDRPPAGDGRRRPDRIEPPMAHQSDRPRSRVIVAGPQVVARGGEQAQAQTTRAPERTATPPPPPSTQLPPRVVSPRQPLVEHKRPVEQSRDARSSFELELERARARTAEREPVRGSEPTAAPVENGDHQAPPARDPSRPAVGTVISLPPRIKITERTPAAGRPPPGPQPVNPIRGRYAQQQQQRGGPRSQGGRPGPHNDFGRKKLPLGKKGKQTTITTPAEHKRVIRIEDSITVADLARNMGIKAPEVLKKLWGMGMTGVNINAAIDFDTAQILASEFGYEVQNVAFKEEAVFAQKPDDTEQMVPRSPVVTVMGHVDHGKTTLLDSIRKARVAAGEAGGITQHVAAYKVAAPGHGDIVFLDTPGHEAFTEMRARGAQATDIVVLVVAANDGVMPQTLEALAHAKDAGVKIIVAVNKIDMPDAAPDRVRQQLADHGLIPEEWGGDTIYANVSALRGEGIENLLAQIAATADFLELRANPDKPAAGLVIEARLDRNRGPMATILIQEGTLRVGDIVVAGRTFGKVRAMLDDRGNSLEEAGPSTPIEVLGLDGVPEAGDQVNAAEDDKVAKQVVEHRRQQERKRELGSKQRFSLENMMERNLEGAIKELKVVLKADVQGSAEAIKTSLTKLSTDKVKVNVIAAAVGGITESDVNLAKAGGAIIVGFHVRPAGKSSKHAEQEGVEIRLYDIIYDALDDVKAAMAGLLAPIKREVAMGKLQVRDTFSIPKMGTVAGCMVTDGKITRKAHLRIIRNAVQVYEGKVGSLRRFKDDVSEVQQGYECGVMIAGWNEIKQNDVIEAYEVIEEAAQL
jgi:translation initiation factor IF-2